MDIKDIKRRILSLLPINSIHLYEFLRLTNIRFDNKKTESAAITCGSNPELILNEEFILNYCSKDEHLLMLIMHELYHLILGHTYLFKNHNLIDNIAFDAIINAILCRMFPDEEYVSFFKNTNSEDKFPGCLLRPLGEKTPKEFKEILHNLYETNTGTYYEVYQQIVNKFKNNNKLINSCVLLGNHNNKLTGQNPLINELVKKISKNWITNNVEKGKAIGSCIDELKIELKKPEENNIKKFNKLLKKICLKNVSYDNEKIEYTSCLINFKDRALYTKKTFYDMPLLYKNTLIESKKINKEITKPIIYLDVSGSVVDYLSDIMPILINAINKNRCRVFTFSESVKKANKKALEKGKFKTSFGTNLNCVFNHYFSLCKKEQSRAILILTDGNFSEISKENLIKIKRRKLSIYFGLFGDYTKKYIENITKYIEEFK